MKFKFRLIIVCAALLLSYAGLGYRLFRIQVTGYSRFSSLARRSYYVLSEKTSPRRGNIYDRNGEVLAVNRHTYSVGYNSSRGNPCPQTVSAVASALNLNPIELRNRMNSGRFVWLARHTEPSAAGELKQIEDMGLLLTKENHRLYPLSPVASHLIGCVGTDNQGLSGVEFNFDHQLRGIQGRRRLVRDARGRLIYSAQDISDEAASVDDIYLTIDSRLQYIAERELKKGFERYSPEWAMALIQKPDTGEILAMAFYPGFDNNAPVLSSEVLNNKAVSNIFEPGSTFKIVTAAAALEENMLRPHETIYCEEGEYEVGGFPIRDFEPHGDLTFTDIMVHSSNIGMAKLGEKLGRNLMYKYSRDFGFGNFTGIRLPGETRGILRKPDSWSGTSLSRISFGQEIGVTGVQLVGAFSAIANGGVLYEPRIISRILSGDSERVFEPLMIRRVVSRETAREVARMMKKSVERGSGFKAQIPGYGVSGKTGTAQKYNPRTFSYKRGKYVALFGGSVPADDPELTILVVFDEPDESLYWGGYVAAPVFREIAEAALSCLGIPPRRDTASSK